jgi:hypothetical protein
MTIGDANWEANQGHLGNRDRWRYALAVIRAQIGSFAAAMIARDRRASDRHQIDIDKIVYPDSVCARAAMEKLETLSTPSVANHSHRSYIWASLLGQLDGAQWDPEILFVAMMLHDLGLTEQIHGSCKGAQCFTLDAVTASTDVFKTTSAPRAERMRRAVLLHLNIEVPGDVHGWEAHYVQAGASLDIVGQRFGELPTISVQSTLVRYPRLNLKNEIVAWTARESRLHPYSRLAVLNRLGFPRVVRRAPFDS